MTKRAIPIHANAVGANRASELLAPSLPAAASCDPASELGADQSQAGELARAEKAEATRRAYKSNLQIFAAWCTRSAGIA